MTSPAGLYEHPDELEQRLRRMENAARLVPARHLRRVSRALAVAPGQWVIHPNRPLWIQRELLADLDIVRDSVIEGAGDKRLLLLLPRDRTNGVPVPDDLLLRDYWQLLFRAKIWLRLGACSKTGEDDEFSPEIQARIEKLGNTVWQEIRRVLESDHLIPHDASDRECYTAFLAELACRRSFMPNSLPAFFPSLSTDACSFVFLPEIDRERLLLETRLDGAADAGEEPQLEAELSATEVEHVAIERVLREAEEPNHLLRKAQQAARLGNDVRAAILRQRAANRDGVDSEPAVDHGAYAALRRGLIRPLAAIRGWDAATIRRWNQAIQPLVIPASEGVWPRAARVLYELQKIRLDLEGDLYAVDPIETIRSLGQQPLRRPLTRAKPVILLRHLSRAASHLRRVPLPAASRQPLEELLSEEIDRVEQTVRAELAPIIRGVFDDVGMTPSNRLEEVAREKLIAELLDTICLRGFLRFGDLRDAIARNQLKMPDLQGFLEFLRGDVLLRVDERLGDELYGVYRRGEIYLRWIQRLTSLSFGTWLGRGLMQYLVMPFGGSFLVVEFSRYLAHETEKLWAFLVDVAPQQTPLEVSLRVTADEPEQVHELAAADVGTTTPAVVDPDVHHAEHAVQFTSESITAIVLLGVVFFGLLHSERCRRLMTRGVIEFGWMVYCLAWAWPLAVWRSPLLIRVRRSRVVRFVSRYLGSGIVAGLSTTGLLRLLHVDHEVATSWGWLAFAIVVLFANSPTGRAVRDWAEERLDDTWREIRVNLIPGLLAWIEAVFRELAGWIERLLYIVDERLRFREGRGESLLLKTVLAALWFPIAYVVRFAFMLLIEPQINPVKHFPVVTVSHKLLLPMIPSLASTTGLSTGTVTLIIGGIPGIFGFIVWELKENWRLYAANRPERQPAVPLGHHGETMQGLLRPGFHSGTVPKCFRRLRQAILTAELTGRITPTARWVHELHDIQSAIRALFDRELIPLLQSTSAWSHLKLSVKSVRLGVQQTEIALDVATFPGHCFGIAFDSYTGPILARIVEPGWIGQISEEQRRQFTLALQSLVEKAAATWDQSSSNLSCLGDFTIPQTWSERVAFWQSVTAPASPAVNRSSSAIVESPARPESSQR